MPIWAAFIAAVLIFVYGCSSVPSAEEKRSPDVYAMQDRNGNRVRLKDERCAGTPAWLDLRTAEMHFQGKDYLACWFTLSQYVVILDSNRDKTPIPMASFTKEEPL